jgi:hypothetical protein
MKNMGIETELLTLAKERFGEFSDAEVKFFTATAKGEEADYRSGNEKADNPENADEWGDKRVLRANVIEWLCTDRKALQFITHKGIDVTGVRVDGQLNLEFAKIDFPVGFFKSVFKENIILQHSKLKILNLTGTYTKAIIADSLEVEGCVYLRYGFKAEGEVILIGADIDGVLDCTNGEFIKPDGIAFIADGMNVKDGVLLKNGFRAEGEVKLIGAEIGGDLDCTNGEFINRKGNAFNADRVNVKGNIFLSNGFKANGGVILTLAEVGGILACDNGEFINPEGFAICAEGLNIKGSVFFRDNFKAEGMVRLSTSVIGGNLECDNGEFVNPKGIAFNAGGIVVKGNVYFRNSFKSEGEIILTGSEIGGTLVCNKGRFINPKGIAFYANGMKVKRDVHFGNGFKSKGEIRFSGSEIGGNLECDNSEFVNPKGNAFVADGVDVNGSVFFRNGLKTEGLISLVSASINGYFIYKDIKSPEKAKLDLRAAKIGTLYDLKKDWPDKGNLYLHGTVYKDIFHESPRDAKRRIKWLRLNGGEGFSPQPYEQLAEVFKRSGHEDDAKEVHIAKNQDRATLGTKLSMAQKLWYKVFGPMIGYGYRPIDVLGLIGILIIFGCVVFGIGYWDHQITPNTETAYVKPDSNVSIDIKEKQLVDTYPKFNLVVYSIDTFVPIIDLHQTKYWIPNANLGPELFTIFRLPVRTGGLLRLYMWFHIMAGWGLTTLLLVGLTGLVRT